MQRRLEPGKIPASSPGMGETASAGIFTVSDTERVAIRLIRGSEPIPLEIYFIAQ